MSTPEPNLGDSGRLPPGQSITDDFPILHIGPVPEFNPATWDFRVWGAVETLQCWTWDQVQDIPRTQVRLDLHCVTKWSKLNTHWEGFTLAFLIKEGMIKLKPEARYLMQHADYGYTTNLPLTAALQENFLIATHFDGKPLTPSHGYPLRAVLGSIPGKEGMKDVYLWKGAKWLRGLEFLTRDRLGFWEANGYHNEGDVWLEQRTSR